MALVQVTVSVPREWLSQVKAILERIEAVLAALSARI